jgi:hypothetical protein
MRQSSAVGRSRNVQRRQDAATWFQSPDFSEWCETAGLEPEAEWQRVREGDPGRLKSVAGHAALN